MDQVAIEPKKSSGTLKIVLIVGTLSVLVCSGLVVGLFTAVKGAMTSAGFYGEAMKRVSSDAEVRQALGVPVEEGFFPQGSVSAQASGGGTAEVAIPISGPKGKGVVEVRATRFQGEWEIEHLVVRVAATGELIDVGSGR